MANYSDLKAAIDVNIRNNGNGEITGDVLNQVLKNMVNVLGGGYQFAGAATTEMNPGTPDNNVYYITTTAGTYTNFGGHVVNDGELALLTYNGNWEKVAVALPAGGGGGSTSGIEFRPLMQGNTELEKQYNIETVNLVKQGIAAPVIVSSVIGGFPDYGITDNVMTFSFGLWSGGAINVYFVSEGRIEADGTMTSAGVDTTRMNRLFNEKILIQGNDATSIKWFIDSFSAFDTFDTLPIPYLRVDSWRRVLAVAFSVGNLQDYAAKISYQTEDGIATYFYNANGNIAKIETQPFGPGYLIVSQISPATLELRPNNFYRVSVSGDTVITLTDTADGSTTKEYVIEIVCTGTPNIFLPSGLIWANDTAPVFTAGKTYVISIIDNLAVFAEFTTAS